jgi:hypothetical protein
MTRLKAGLKLWRRMMVAYVYSTATNSISYVEYENTASNELAIARKFPNGKPMKVTIQGGHGVSDKYFRTPQGVVTKIEDHELEMLLANPSFKKHVDRGFMTYDKKKVEPAKKAANMESKDGSAPITPADYVETEDSTPGRKVYAMKDRQIG